MKRALCAFTAALLILLSALPVYADPKQGKSGSVLLIYDEPDLVELTENILTAAGRAVDTVQIRDYSKDMLAPYKYIVLLTPAPLKDMGTRAKVLCIGEGFAIPGVSTTKVYGAGLEITAKDFYQYSNYIPEFSVISEFEGETFGKMTMSFEREYPFGIKTGNIYYAPYLSGDNISTFALGEMLPDFFSTSYRGGIYVIIEDVFAFSDLDMLCKTADELYLANIPFIVKAMPIYTNTELDAFARYTQALRYVESRNGAVVMTPPLINGKATDEEIKELTVIATKALTDQGVTVLPSVEGFYFVDMEYLKEVKSPAKRYETFSFDVGILENLPRTDLQLKQMVANLNGRWYEFGSYREKFGLSSSMFLEIPVDDEIAARVTESYTPAFFAVGSNILMIAVSVMLAFICLLIYISRRRYRGKFKKKEG